MSDDREWRAKPDAAGAENPQRRRPVLVGTTLAPVLVVAVWLGFHVFSSAEPAESPDVAGASAAGLPTPAVAESDEEGAAQRAKDAEWRERALGEWVRDHYGRWTMTLEADGTATLVVVPDRIWALALGPKITVDLEWQIKEGKAVFDSLRGEPESSFNAAMKFWKKHQSRKIVELTDDRFVYLSDDGTANSEWRRK